MVSIQARIFILQSYKQINELASICWGRGQAPQHRTVGLNSKNPPKIAIYKFREIIGKFDLTNFEYQVSAMTRNRNHVNLFKLDWEKFVKSHQVNLSLAGFSHLGPLCSERLNGLTSRPSQQYIVGLCISTTSFRIHEWA